MTRAVKALVLLSLSLLAGCAGVPPKMTVYGASGKQYVAPELCGAIVECKKANEQACYYDALILTTANGEKEITSCRAAK